MRTATEQKLANTRIRLAIFARKRLKSLKGKKELVRPRGIEPLFAP